MLLRAEQVYQGSSQRIAELKAAVSSYRAALVAQGYLAWKSATTYENAELGRVFLSGIICDFDALTSAAMDSREIQPIRDIPYALVSNAPAYQEYAVLNSEDDSYCRHTGWSSITLISDYVFGISPVVCDVCGGTIALYRATSAQQLTARIQSWHTLYDSICACYMEGNIYESWADTQLSDISSPLNAFGLSLVPDLQNAMRCSVSYFLHTPEGKSHPRCPRCNGPLRNLLDTRYNARCDNCNIVTSGS